MLVFLWLLVCVFYLPIFWFLRSNSATESEPVVYSCQQFTADQDVKVLPRSFHKKILGTPLHPPEGGRYVESRVTLRQAIRSDGRKSIYERHLGVKQ